MPRHNVATTKDGGDYRRILGVPIPGAKRRSKPRTSYRPGDLVLVDRKHLATVRECFPEGSCLFPWPYCVVDFGRSARQQALSRPKPTDGECGIKVALSRLQKK